MTRSLISRLAVAALAIAFAAPALAANGLSNLYEQKVLEAIFKQTNVTAPTTLYVGLNSADPGDTCASELASTGAYARAQLNPDTNNATNTNYNAIDAASQAPKTILTNKLAITFPTATANWNSGNAITYFTLWDASTAGNCVYSGSITPSGVVVLNGNTLSFAGGSPGQLTFTVD